MMKLKSKVWGILFTLVVALSACKESGQKTEKTNTDSAKVQLKNQAENTAFAEKATCSQKGKDGEETLQTCLYKNYKAVQEGFPDLKGRYSYRYTLFKKENGKEYKEIKNAEMFEKGEELLAIINSKIKKDYETFASDPQSQDCFEGQTFKPFGFDELGISFDEKNINFNVTFGLMNTCMSVDGTIVSFAWQDIEKYLKP